MQGQPDKDARLKAQERARLMRMAGAASIGVAVTLTGLKGWAWQSTDSVALLSSFADSLLDLVASLITFAAVRGAVEPPDREHRFGHGKLEGVAGIVQAAIISGSAAFVAFRAVLRIISPSEIEAASFGIGVMTTSLLFTFGLVAFQRYVIGRTGSLAVKADAAHYQADVLTGIGVILAIFLSARFELLIADPLIGLAIAGFILASVLKIVKDALDILLDRELSTDDRARIKQLATAHSEVWGVHDIRTRSSGSAQFIQLHLELDKNLTLDEAHAISDEVEASLKLAFPDADVLIHADPHGLKEERDSF
jgi:ferrous-iron efflux pump FieF